MCSCWSKYHTPLYVVDSDGYMCNAAYAYVNGFEKSEPVPLKLMMCTKCHAVFAMPIEEKTTEDA